MEVQETIFSNDELKKSCEDFLSKTYKKYFFSNSTGNDYLYYGSLTDEYMVPDDAIAIGLNYRKFVEEKKTFHMIKF